MGRISDTAKTRLARLKAPGKEGVFAPVPSKKASARGSDAMRIKQRQNYERIPEGNVRRGKLTRDEVED